MADATAASETAHEVTIEDIGPAKKQITITVPPEAIAEKIRESVGTLAAQTALPGFRKGRAPQRLIEKRFGTEVHNESKNQIIADAYSRAIEEHGLKPIGEPEPDDSVADVKLEAGKPLTFSVKVEVVPELEIPDLKDIELFKPVFEVTPEQLEAEMQRQRLRQGTITKIESGFREGDRLVGRATVRKAGEAEPLFQSDQVMVIFPGEADGGRGHVLGLLIEGLAGRLAPCKVGDRVSIKTTGPGAHEREDIRGADLEISYEIADAARVEPASAEQVVAHYGLESAEILQAQIRLGLEQRRLQEQTSALHEQVENHLLAAVDLELPEQVSAAQVTRALDRQRVELQYRGLTGDEIEARIAEVRADSELAARNRLKLFFIMHRLAEHLGIEVSDQEVNGRIAAMASHRGMRPERLRAEMTQSGQLAEVLTHLREHRVCDRLIEQAKVTEVSEAEWRTPLANAAAKSKKKTKKPAPTAKKTPAEDESKKRSRKSANAK